MKLRLLLRLKMPKTAVEYLAFVARVLLVRMEMLVLLDLLALPYVSQQHPVSFVFGRSLKGLNWISPLLV